MIIKAYAVLAETQLLTSDSLGIHGMAQADLIISRKQSFIYSQNNQLRQTMAKRLAVKSTLPSK